MSRCHLLKLVAAAALYLLAMPTPAAAELDALPAPMRRTPP
ncbi:hypothetical protein [Methylosinus sp. Sm6]|nr:hypothetical protein [Methylosinus sp. Sm6]